MAMPIGHFEDIQNEDAIESYVDRIFELVGNRTNGVWSTQIDVEYKKKYQKSLPDKWPSKIESSQEGSQKLRVDEPINGRYIIYPIITESNEEIPESKPVNQQNNEKNVNSNNSNTTTSKLEPKKSRPPKLKLPEDANWDVYITCVHSTMNVCLRILGDAYSGKVRIHIFSIFKSAEFSEFTIPNPFFRQITKIKTNQDDFTSFSAKFTKCTKNPNFPFFSSNH